MKHFLLSFLLFTFSFGQNCSNLNIQWQSDIATTCPEMTMTMLHDRSDLDYLYVANKEAGLRIYDVSIPSAPQMVKQIPISELLDLDVMNVSQTGQFLYLALGNSFSSGEQSGMAIVDVTDPPNAIVTDVYTLANSDGGAGVAVSDGNYAYLGAMVNGVVVLDVQDKNNIVELSVFHPDFTFPAANPDSTKINARGMELRNDTLFLCLDAGGLRIIDATNKTQLQEVGRYSNPLLNSLPRAYNNLVLDGNTIYVTFDYCGVEALDVSNPEEPSLISWWNPYNCPGNNWFSSSVHANEIKMDACKRLFVSTGKSDMIILDASNPSQIDSCNFYGGVTNNLGTWGVDLYENNIYLSYVCAIIPFASNWTGVKILSFNACNLSVDDKENDEINLNYDEQSGYYSITTKNKLENIRFLNLLGQELKLESQCLSGNSLCFRKTCQSELYLIELVYSEGIQRIKF